MASDLISREAAIRALVSSNGDYLDALERFERLPAVDAAPVVHARWIDHKDEHQCTACKEFTVVDAYVWMQLRYDFCPYCGARIDGEDSNEQANP